MDPTQLQQIGLTEDQIVQLMQLGVLADEGDTINKELEMAKELRQRPGPQGRFTGRAYTKANPMEHIAGAVNNIRGQYQQHQGIKQQRQNAQRQADLRTQYMKALLQKQQGQGATMTPSQIGPGGIAPPQRTPAQMFPMPAAGQSPTGATMAAAMLRGR